MYGLIPNANNVALSSDPPVMDDIMLRKLFSLIVLVNCAGSIPGTGM